MKDTEDKTINVKGYNIDISKGTRSLQFTLKVISLIFNFSLVLTGVCFYKMYVVDSFIHFIIGRILNFI